MRSALLALALALSVVAYPAHAQDGRIILDLMIRVVPGNQGDCFILDSPDTLEVTVQSADASFDPMVPPVLLFLGHYRTSPAGPGDPPEIQGVPITPSKTITTLTTIRGLYCYTLNWSLTPSTPVAIGPDERSQWRFVALKMVLTSQ